MGLSCLQLRLIILSLSHPLSNSSLAFTFVFEKLLLYKFKSQIFYPKEKSQIFK